MNAECEECGKKQLAVQRWANADHESVTSVPPLVGEVLRSPGEPLESRTRALMESGLGHDFSRVRVHRDSRAAESAQAINAQAFTVGTNIVFAAGQYTPDTENGKKLLAHELVHTLQQEETNTAETAEAFTISHPDSAGEREADQVATQMMAGPGPGLTATASSQHLVPTAGLVQRQAPRGTFRPLERGEAPPPRSMKREEFVETMQIGFHVRRIRTGAFVDQSVPGLRPSEWTSWDPGDSSPIYTSIVEAFEDFQERLGATPPVYEMIFFRTRFDIDQRTGLVRRDAAGNVIPDSGASASFAQGELRIYSTVTSHDPVARELLKPAAPTPAESVRENITHELGHGVENVVAGLPHIGWRGADPGLLNDYMNAVGWIGDRLFDLNVPLAEIRRAIDAQKPLPPNAREITRDNWSKKSMKWKESPLTVYMLYGPSEDFAEAISFYVEDPGLLRSLSPIRYAFIEQRKKEWLPFLEAHQTPAGRKGIGGGIPDVRRPATTPSWSSSRE
jgi:hypothetical protein